MELEKASGKEIFEYMINSVVSTEVLSPEEELEIEERVEREEEVEEEIKGEEEIKEVYQPKLKIFFVESEIKPKELETILYSTLEQSTKIKHLLEKYHIAVRDKEEPFSLLIFTNKKYKEKHYFLIESHSKYFEIYTVEKGLEVGRTIKKVIDELSGLDLVWIAREKLLDLVKDVVTAEGVHGFTAQRKTLHFDKRVTIRVFGGDTEDVETANKYFYSEPTRIYFKKRNSPQAAIVGAIADDGYLRIDRILPDSIDLFLQTKDEIWNRYRGDYEPLIEAINKLGKQEIKIDDKTIATFPKAFVSITFSIPPKLWEIKTERIYEAINDQFIKQGKEYIGYRWCDDNTFFIYDLVYGGMYRLRIDKSEKKVVVCPDENVSGKGLSTFCSSFIENIEHSVRPIIFSEVFINES